MTAGLPLRGDTIDRLPARVAVPTYDRAALTPAVVHMSVGSFHRAHQAVYFDEIAERGISTEWGIVGVGLRRPEMGQVMAAQDGLYTVVARGADGDEARVVGVMSRYLLSPDQDDAVLDTLADPRTRIVTLTITGRGYKLDPITGRLDPTDAALVGDLADPGHPVSALGYIVEGLDRRRRAGLPPFTVLSCDNLPDNGALARRAVVAFASLRDPDLAAWIEEHGAFPSSMVDRITPRTTDEDRRRVARELGVRDRWPVMTEPYSEWIIEDDFCNGRPPLDLVGARFVADVRPFALLKTRLLNGSHCALGYLGCLAGLERIDEAMADPVFAAYVTALMKEEVAPLLPPVPGVDLGAYVTSLLERFANPAIADQLARLSRAGSAKMPRHVISSIRESRALGRPHPRLTLAVAAWCRFLQGTDEAGGELPIDDPLAERLQRLARRGGGDPRPLLRERSIFGALGDDPRFVREVRHAMARIERDGVRGAMLAAGAPLPAAPLPTGRRRFAPGRSDDGESDPRHDGPVAA